MLPVVRPVAGNSSAISGRELRPTGFAKRAVAVEIRLSRQESAGWKGQGTYTGSLAFGSVEREDDVV